MDSVKSFINRHKVIITVVSIVFIGLPQYIDSIWDLTEKIIGKPITMTNLNWAYWITVPLGAIIAIAVWAFRNERPVSNESGNELIIKVRRSSILNYYPQPSVFGHYNIIEVETEFHPKGYIKLHSIELHTGRNTFLVKNLPVIIVDRDSIYPIPFEVPNKIIEYQKTSADNYLRVLYNDKDCRSDNFSFNMVYEANGKKYLIR